MSNLPPEDDSAARGSGKAEDRENTQQKLHQLLAGLWERSRETIAVHVGVLQHAKSLADRNQLDEAARARAVDSAHKLAGVLGTFGLPRGTELARVAEEAFGTSGAMSQVKLEGLGSALNELDSLIQAAGTYERAHPLENPPPV